MLYDLQNSEEYDGRMSIWKVDCTMCEYKFSVVMPIYNVEKYLEETITSVINQSIGFIENIQLILVNDGSSDESSCICRNFSEKYPQNIVFIEQSNKGVSAARNLGAEYVKGKYVNFMDSDDIWGENAFSEVWDFFEKHHEKIDLVTCPQFFFEAKRGKHALSYKFEKGSRIIDIINEPDAIVLNVCASFIKAEQTKQVYFDELISIGEDAKYITDILLRKPQYGVVNTAKYMVRKRLAGTSITQRPNITKYTLTMDRYYCEIARMSMRTFGRVIPYVQFAIANGIKYRLHGTIPDELQKQDRVNYIDTVVRLVQLLEDDMIMNMPNSSVFTKIYMMELKYGIKMIDKITVVGSDVYFSEKAIGELPANTVVVESVIINSRKAAIVRGKINWFNGVDTIPFFFSADSYGHTAVQLETGSSGKKSCCGDNIYQTANFLVQVPLNTNIAFHIKNNNEYVRITPKLKVKGYAFKVDDEGTLIIKRVDTMKAKFRKGMKKLLKRT